jgi:hypothetical protein
MRCVLTALSQDSQELSEKVRAFGWPFLDEHIITHGDLTSSLQSKICAHYQKIVVSFSSESWTVASGFFRIYDASWFLGNLGNLFRFAFSVDINDVKCQIKPLVFFVD